MKKRFYAVIFSFVMALQPAAALASETGAQNPVETVTDGAELLAGITTENYPRVDGSTATLPLSAAVYQLVTGCSLKDADEAIVHSKTTNAWLKLVSGEADLLIVADKNETVDSAMAEAGVSLDIKPIALDAFVFMTNEENPVESLTSQQIVDIYSGVITNWSQVGGEDKEIIPFQRNENAGSQTAMKSLVMKGAEMIPPEKLEIDTMSGLLEAVASYNNEANALGYSYYYYSNLMYQTPGLRFMAVDGVIPQNETVQNGTYPYIARYYAAVRSDEPEGTPARLIYDWLTTTSGQELAADLGYIPVDETVSPQQIHYDEYAAGPLPIGEDERLMVVAGNNTLLVLDQNGTVTQKFENAAAGGDSLLGNWQDAQVVSVSDPVSINIKTGEGEYDYKAGLYSLQEDRWILEPVYEELYVLSDKLITDSSIMMGGGCLMTTDGTVLAETEYYAFTRMGDYVFDDKNLFDLDGNWLASFDGYANQAFDDRILISSMDGSMLMLGEDGSTLWQMGPELTYIESCGEYLNWVDQNGAGIITDLNWQRVTDDVQFYQKNPDQGLTGNGLRLVSQSPDGERNLVKLTDSMYQDYYYVCDSEYRILDSYVPGAAQHLILDYTDFTAIPWIWYLKDDNQLCLNNLWTGETLTTDCFGNPDIGVSINHVGSMIAVHLVDDQWNYTSQCFIHGTAVGEPIGRWVNLMESTDGVKFFSIYDVETDSNSNTYFLEDGTQLDAGETSEIVYADGSLCCVRRGAYLYVEDHEGNLYVRLLCSDEERTELINVTGF